MRCLKCGRELESEQVFCDECLQEMEKYPVAPDAKVQLPLRHTPPARKPQPKRRTVPAEEQLPVLKKRLWILTGLLAVTVALIAAMVYPTITFFLRNYYLRPGQNYTAVVTVSPQETTDPFEGMAE